MEDWSEGEGVVGFDAVAEYSAVLVLAADFDTSF